MKVLVTGGSGFIGSHLVRRLLAEGSEVVVLDHRLGGKGLDASFLAKVEGVEADACDPKIVTRAAQGCDLIYAFAALVGVEHYSSNPVGTMQVEERALEAACAAALTVGAGVIYPSSSAVYGNVAGRLGEDRPTSPTSNYAIAKRFNELFLAAQHRQCGLRSVALRIFNVYGPGQDQRLVIPRFARAALDGQPLVVFGDGNQVRDFPYVGDVVEAVWRCSKMLDGCEVINVATGVGHSIREVAESVVKLAGGRSQVELRPMPVGRAGFEVSQSIGVPDKLASLTGFTPSTSLEEGLQAVLDWTAVNG